MIQPRLSQGFPLLPGRIASSRFELPGCLTPIACEAGQERLRLILSWGALPFQARQRPCADGPGYGMVFAHGVGGAGHAQIAVTAIPTVKLNIALSCVRTRTFTRTDFAGCRCEIEESSKTAVPRNQISPVCSEANAGRQLPWLVPCPTR